MRKKILLALCVVLILCVAGGGITACKDADEVYGEWSVQKQPTCDEKGTEIAYCKNHNGEHFITRDISALNHDMGEWETVKEPTLDDKGTKRRECKRCGYSEEEPLPEIETKYVLSVAEGSKVVKKVKIAADGKYKLTQPEKLGYKFEGYFDSENTKYELEGVVDKNVTVSAKWSITETSTFAQLYDYLLNGVDKVHITADIEISGSLYVVSETEIYVDSDVKLIRSNNFAGEIFVLGEDEKGNSVLLGGKTSVLNLKTDGQHSLIIDGNGQNVDASGSAFLILNSGTLNIYDGVVITDCKKLSNKKINSGKYEISYPERIGGAAICVCNGELNIYGGKITDCEINLDETNVSEGDTELRASSCGGAIYNYGSTNIYGGVISNNRASRGGAIYNYREMTITGGRFENNYSTVYGGAIYLAGSQYSVTNIGAENSDSTVVSVVFVGNRSEKSGGAMFGQTLNSIYIMGETLFENNVSEQNNGGAINTSGALTVKNANFKNNSAQSKGGAIYAYYSNPDRTVRMVDISSGSFVGNSASKGGAIAVSATKDTFDKGAICFVGNVKFIDNSAFATTGDDSEIPDGNEFGGTAQIAEKVSGETESTADKNFNGNGGAIYLSRKGKLTLENATFSDNSSERRGGAVYITGASLLEAVGTVVFDANTSVRGGALFVYDNSRVSGSKIVLNSNKADERGGAIYVSSSTVTSSEILAGNNEILSKELPTDDNGKEDSTECSGGVLSAYSKSVVTVGKFISNSNTSTGNGGAVYVSDSDVTLMNVTANENKSLLGNGGVFAVHSDGCLTVDGISAENNTANNGNGGVLYARSSRAVIGSEGSKLVNKLIGNTAKGGGAIYVSVADEKADSSVVNLKVYSLALTSNAATNNCGGIYLYENAVGELSDITATANTAQANGGVLYLYKTSICTATNLVANKNVAIGNGGVIYASGSTLKIVDGGDSPSVFSENSAVKGAAIYLTSQAQAAIDNMVGNGNKTTDNGSCIYITSDGTIANIENGSFSSNVADGANGTIYVTSKARAAFGEIKGENNSAKGGGFMYVTSEGTVVDIAKCEVNNNTATGNGGAMYFYTKAKVTIGELIASGNSAVNGGVMYASGASDITIGKAVTKIGSKTDENGNAADTYNTAESGGFIYATTANTAVTINGGDITAGNLVSDETKGIAIYTNSASVKFHIKGYGTQEFVKYNDGDIKGKAVIADIPSTDGGAV